MSSAGLAVVGLSIGIIIAVAIFIVVGRATVTALDATDTPDKSEEFENW